MLRRTLILSAALALGACSANDFSAADAAQKPPPGELVRSSKPRLTAQAPADDLAQLTHDDADFAFALLREAAPKESFFVSPHSMSLALAMTYAGARGRTAEEMAVALRFRLPPPRLHAAMGSVDLALAARKDAVVESGEPFELAVVNAIFGQRGYVFLAPFLDTLAESYGAGLSLLDFASDPEGSRSAINGWVSDRTHARIPVLLPAGIVRSSTVLVLTNAIHFKASWAAPFEPASTSDGPFTTLDGTAATAAFMHHSKEHRYARGDGFEALELGYVGGDVSMLVILPERGTFDSFVRVLDAQRLEAIVASLGAHDVDVTLPRFTFRTKLAMKDVLAKMGMRDAFEGGTADFSGMDGSRSLYVQDVVHEAFIAVDEKGTEAAAATAVVVGRVSAPERATFTADRPFLVVIRDAPTGTVLFVGQVTAP